MSAANQTAWDRTVAATVAVGERVLAPVERFVGARSLVGEHEFFSLEDFPWAAQTEARWEVVRDELTSVLGERAALPSFQEISRDQAEISDDDRWKTLFLYGYGYKTALGSRLCPQTTALVEQIPGMVTAMFSILSPGKRIPPHRGPYKGLLRYHLGLVVPEQKERCWIRVGSQRRSWEAGAGMIFDDTFEHEVHNDTDELRAVLFLDVVRPLPRPYADINSLIVKAIALSPFIRDARRNQEAWEKRFLAGRRDLAPAHGPFPAAT